MFIHKYFPNYELFWKKYVVPKTNRPQNIFLKSVFLKKENENEALITQVHYSILLHFYFINKYMFHCDDDFVFENLIIRLSSITDLTEEFLFRYLVYLKKN